MPDCNQMALKAEPVQKRQFNRLGAKKVLIKGPKISAAKIEAKGNNVQPFCAAFFAASNGQSFKRCPYEESNSL